MPRDKVTKAVDWIATSRVRNAIDVSVPLSRHTTVCTIQDRVDCWQQYATRTIGTARGIHVYATGEPPLITVHLRTDEGLREEAVKREEEARNALPVTQNWKLYTGATLTPIPIIRESATEEIDIDESAFSESVSQAVERTLRELPEAEIRWEVTPTAKPCSSGVDTDSLRATRVMGFNAYSPTMYLKTWRRLVKGKDDK